MQSASTHQARRWAVAAAITALMTASGAASAAKFVAKFDPLFNLDFNAEVDANVGWKGSVLVDVDESCLSPGIHSVGGWSSCESATLESGTLSFYDIDTNADILNLAWVDGPPEIIKLKVDGSLNLTGIDIDPAVKFSGVTLFDEKWDIKLDFTLNFPTLKLTEVCDSYGSRSSYKFKCDPEVFRSGQDGAASLPQTVWSRVPEPTSLALVGLALAPMGLVRRRRERGES